MKKIIAIILALAALFTLCACGEEEGPTLADVAAMYESSAPTKIVTNTVEVIGTSTKLNTNEVLVTGKIDGKLATVYTCSKDQLAEINSGAEIKSVIETIETSKEYYDGLVRENGGRWSQDYNFAPAAGDIAINLAAENLTNVVFNGNTVTFTVAADKTAAVFGEDKAVEADVSVEIINDGAYITGINLTYTIVSDDDYPEVVVTISTVYTYDLEEITLIK